MIKLDHLKETFQKIKAQVRITRGALGSQYFTLGEHKVYISVRKMGQLNQFEYQIRHSVNNNVKFHNYTRSLDGILDWYRVRLLTIES